MTILDWLLDSMKKLAEAGVDSPRRDALVLLEDTIEKERSWVIAHPEYDIAQNDLKKVNKLISRRLNREPLAYIRGIAWFYGRFFEVNPDVLIPRPESENFIEILKQLKPKAVAEIGTGSGCLAITAKLELGNDTKVIASDISSKALEIAKINAAKHNTDIRFLGGSLFEPFEDISLEDYVIIANLPYVPDGLITSPEIKLEPKAALFSGKDGLDHYAKFWDQLSKKVNKPEYILVESLEDQHTKMNDMATQAGYSLEKTDVLVQLFSEIS